MMRAFFLIVGDVFTALCHAFLREDCGALLDDVGGAVEFGGLSAVPHSVQGHLLTVGRGEHQLTGNYAVAAAGSGEACGLGQEQNSMAHFFCTLNGVNAAWKLGSEMKAS